MARRVPHYPDPYLPLNYLATIGSTISILTSFIFLALLQALLASKSLTCLILNLHELFTGAVNKRLEYGIGRSGLDWLDTTPFIFHTFSDTPFI